MQRRRLASVRTVRVAIVSVACAWIGVVILPRLVVAQQPSTTAASGLMPRYDANRNLLLPDGYRRWVLVGSSLGLSYSESGQGPQMFNTTLMEPSAYEHFVRTGTFREGTMLALILQGIGTNALPARGGQFATDVHAVEMAVKDSTRVPEAWAYYNFGGTRMGGLRTNAAPQPKNNCFTCHDEHAGRDHVFVQFYGLLNEAIAGTPHASPAAGARSGGPRNP